MSTYVQDDVSRGGRVVAGNATSPRMCVRRGRVWRKMKKRRRRRRTRMANAVEGKERSLPKSSSSPPYLSLLFHFPSHARHRGIYVAEAGRYNYSRFEIILPFHDTTRSHTDDRDRPHKPYRSSRGFKRRHDLLELN